MGGDWVRFGRPSRGWAGFGGGGGRDKPPVGRRRLVWSHTGAWPG